MILFWGITMNNNLLHAGFVAASRHTPENIALVNGSVRLTYRALYQAGMYLAQEIQQSLRQFDKNFSPNERIIVVSMENGWRQIVSFLGILFADAVCLFIDPSVSQEQIAAMLENAGALMIIVDKQKKEKLEKIDKLKAATVVFEFGIHFGMPKDDKLNIIRGSILQGSDSAYRVFSTSFEGEYRQSLISHEDIVNKIHESCSKFDIHQSDALLCLANKSIDDYIHNIFCLLSVSGKVVLLTELELNDSRSWLKLMKDESITVLDTSPRFLSVLGGGQYDAVSLKVIRAEQNSDQKNKSSRIDLAEIESAILTIEKIKKAHCISYKKKLFLFCEVEKKTARRALKLNAVCKNFLLKKLPRYMQPKKIFFIKKLPVNNQKIDNTKLIEKFIHFKSFAALHLEMGIIK